MSGPLLRRVLLTNDDGIAAPGLALLERIAAQLAEEVWVVAPEHDQSGTGQGISVHSPLRVYRHDERRFAVSGTPSDCVMFAMAEWLQDSPPDLVLSGVNSGANIGDSVPYSGTLGAVLSADLLGLPAIGLSQAFLDRTNIDWSCVETYAETAIRALWMRREDGGCCWNLNFPACPAEAVTHLRMTQQSRARLRARACRQAGTVAGCRIGGSASSIPRRTSSRLRRTSPRCARSASPSHPCATPGAGSSGAKNGPWPNWPSNSDSGALQCSLVIMRSGLRICPNT